MATVAGCTSGIDPELFTPVCGDGRRDGVEGCDDRNREAGDGCSPVCTQEAGFICLAPPCMCDRSFNCDTGCECDLECSSGQNPTVCNSELSCREVSGAAPALSIVWMQRCIPISVTSLGKVFSREENRDALAWATAAWTAECSDLHFVDAGVTDQKPGFDVSAPGRQRNTVTSADTSEEVAQGLTGIVGIALTSYLSATGEILDADIILNAVEFDFGPDCAAQGSAMHLPSVLTALLGSALGFEYVDDVESSVGRSIAPCDTSKQDISESDRARLCSMYPYGRPSNACRPPPGGYVGVSPNPFDFRDQCARLDLD